jgi:hypothetical protein
VEGEVSGIDRPGPAKVRQKLTRDPCEVGRGNRSAGGDAARPERRDDLDPRMFCKYAERTRHFTADVAVVVEESVAAMDQKVVRNGSGAD